MIAGLIRAFTNELRAFRDIEAPMGSVNFIMSDAHKPIHNTPAVLIQLNEETEPQHYIGGAVMYQYRFTVSVLANFSNQSLSEDSMTELDLLDYAEKIINHISMKGWLTDEMKTVVLENNFNLTIGAKKIFDADNEHGSTLIGLIFDVNTTSLDSGGTMLKRAEEVDILPEDIEININ